MEQEKFEALIEFMANRDKINPEATIADKFMAAAPEFTMEQVIQLCGSIEALSQALVLELFFNGRIDDIGSLFYQWFLRGIEMGRELERRA